jgi:hypothetical protein
LAAVPPWIMPNVTTLVALGADSRLASVCAAVTNCATAMGFIL